MTELEVRRAIVQAIDAGKYNRKPLRKYIDSGIDVETLATIIAYSFTSKGSLSLSAVGGLVVCSGGCG